MTKANTRKKDIIEVSIDSAQRTCHYKNGVLHREDGPARYKTYGIKGKFKNKLINQEFWVNGKLHRDKGPAIIYKHDRKIWMKNGIIHRKRGPAVIREDGYKEWIVNGVTHRLRGPAKIWPNGPQHWYKNGVLWKQTSGEDYISIKKGDFSYHKEWDKTFYYKNGKMHRRGAPALIVENRSFENLIYYFKEQMAKCKWTFDDMLRVVGIKYDENDLPYEYFLQEKGNFTLKAWYLNGKLKQSKLYLNGEIFNKKNYAT